MMRLGFRSKVMIIVGVCSVLLTFTVSYIDQQRLIARVVEGREIQKSLVQDNILSALSRIDSTFHVLDRDLEAKMREYSYLLGELYKENPNFDSWNYEALKRDFGGLDIYIINEESVITHSSFLPDIGFDFNFAPHFLDHLAKIRTSGEFVADNMDTETQTGRLRKYSYFPTHDGKFIIELGYPLTDNEVFEKLNFLEVTKQLVDDYPMVKDITVYTADGGALGKISPDGKKAMLDERFAAVLEGDRGKDGWKLIFPDADDPDIVHEFIAYSVVQSADSLQYANYRLVEIVYNEEEWSGYLGEDRNVFLMQLALTLLLTILISYGIARLISRPMYLAFHDVLTGLSNRAAFETELARFFKKANGNRSQYHMAVLTLDLDNFKRVNDSLGHDGGDRLLKECAARIRNAVGKTDIVARLGGDEFAILMLDIRTEAEAEKAASQLLAELDRPVTINGIDVMALYHVTASIGIAFAPVHGQDPQTIYKNADHAMYRAKTSGKNTFRIYDPEQGEHRR